MRIILVILMPILIAGCALPLPIRIASWAIDGISYLATRKSLAEHGLSALTGEDCRFLRAVTDSGVDDVCLSTDELQRATAVALVQDAEAPEDAVADAGGVAGSTSGQALDAEDLGRFETAAGGTAARTARMERPTLEAEAVAEIHAAVEVPAPIPADPVPAAPGPAPGDPPPAYAPVHLVDLVPLEAMAAAELFARTAEGVPTVTARPELPWDAPAAGEAGAEAADANGPGLTPVEMMAWAPDTQLAARHRQR